MMLTVLKGKISLFISCSAMMDAIHELALGLLKQECITVWMQE